MLWAPQKKFHYSSIVLGEQGEEMDMSKPEQKNPKLSAWIDLGEQT